MAALTMFINGQEIETEEGRTVLEAATEAGITIPTLCHHPAVTSSGGCRMCLVEVEPRGQLHPSCTFPVSPGLRVQTHSEKVLKARRFVLELLFSEHSHYCMYCAADGDCELQTMAYYHEMDHWLYPRSDVPRMVDASRQYFIMDHNRCILCRRCIRACSEIAAVHTLGMGQRGAESLVVADLDVPFGRSTCISCGSCLDVCPVGALVDRRSAYMGGDADLESHTTVCAQCSLGCTIVARTRSDRLIRIDSDWGNGPSNGLLCRAGRFEPLQVTAPRVRTPLVREGDELVPCSWDEALKLVSCRLVEADSLAAAASTRATNEELSAFQTVFAHLQADLGTFDGMPAPASPGGQATAEDFEQAALVMAIAAELDDEHEVAACWMRRARDHGARLVLSDCRADRLSGPAERVSPERLEAVIADLGDADRMVVVYGPGADGRLLDRLAARSEVTFLSLPGGVNAAGAAAIGLEPIASGASADVTYVYAADSLTTELPAEGGFRVVQSCYRTALTDNADVVLPALHWTEKEGHFTGPGGGLRTVVRVVGLPQWVRDDRDVLSALVGLAEVSR